MSIGAGTSSGDDETAGVFAVRREGGPMIDEIRIRDWLAAYRHAWSTDDPDEISALFTTDVRYFTAPYRAPLDGVRAITDYWVGEREGDIPWSFEYQVLAQEGDLFVVRAVTTYPQGTGDADGPETFHNLWLVTLGADGRVSEFVEYFMLAE
jgi:ketosteroid isomerase-like protein